MATNWRYRAESGEQGPVTFLQLAELLNTGAVTPETLVQDDRTKLWRRVEDVAGLLAQARRLQAGPLPAASGAQESPLEKTPRLMSEDLPPDEPRTPWGAYAGLMTIITLVALEVWWLWPRTPEPFPKSQPITLKFETPKRLQQLAPRSRKNPKRLLEPVGPPTLLPGLEGVAWAKNPVLTSDLLTIVYISWGGDETLDDLFMAERTAPDLPFGVPVRLQACSGPKRETFPALSPDGLQLIYAEDAGPTRLMLSRRAQRGQLFAEPQQLPVEKVEAGYTNIDNAQFIGTDLLQIAATAGDLSQRAHFLAQRQGPGVTIVGKLGLADPWPRYFLTANRRRAYFLSNEGLCVTMQAPRTPLFTTAEVWLTSEQLGPELSKFDDSVWIAPSEDVLVYCTQGTTNPASRDRQLWIQRLE